MTAKIRFAGRGYTVSCQPCNWHCAEQPTQAHAERERLRHNRDHHTKGNR